MTRSASLIALAACALLASCSAFEREGGLRQLWRHETPSVYLGSDQAGVDGRHFYALRGERRQRLHAYRLEDGALAWSAAISNVCSPILTDGERVFCPSDRLDALDAATGRALWSFAPDSTLQLVEGAAAGGRVFAGSLSTAYALDSATGALLWRRSFRAGDWLGTRLRGFAVSGDTLFVTMEALYSENGFFSASAIVALDAASGRELWRFQDGDGTDSRKIGGLAVAGGVLLYSDAESGQQVVAVDRSTRQVRWRVRRMPGFLGTRRAPAVAEGVAYVAEGDELLYTIDVATGAVRWRVKPDRGSYLNHEVCGSLFVANNKALAIVQRSNGKRVDVLFARGGEDADAMAVREGRLYLATTRAVYAYDCR